MQLPGIVKQVGRTNGRERVYVEDYVYTYLQGLKKEAGLFPLRAALFGHAYQKNACSFYMIYGAACVTRGPEQDKNEEQVRKEYFENFDLIGYVNIYTKGQELSGKREGYYIFYEKNVPMQNYLLSCYEMRNRKPEKEKVQKKGKRRSSRAGSVKDTARKIFYGGCIIILAIAVTAINDYNKMHGFVEAAGKAVVFAETEK